MTMRFAVFLSSICCGVFLFSCASKPPDTASEVFPAAEETVLELPKTAWSRSVPFRHISQDILDAVKIGSPESLRFAVSHLRRADESYSEDEAVLLYTAASVLLIVYAEDAMQSPLPPVPIENNYIAAIDSARKGTYEHAAADSSDMLLCVLPSLLLFTVPSVSNYYAEAETSLRSAAASAPDSVLAAYMLGLLYMRQHRPQEASAVLKPFCADGSGYISMALLFCESLRASDNFEEAYKCALRLYSRFPDNADVLKMCAETSLKLNDYEASERFIAQVLQREPDNLAYILFRAHILMEKHDYIKVSSLLDLYARTDKTSKDYLLLRASLQRNWNRNEAAVAATLEEALKLYPVDEEVLLFAAVFASESGRKIADMDALAVAEKTLAAFPQNTAALGVYADELMRLRRWEDAYEVSRRIFSSDRADRRSLFRHAEICVSLGLAEEAAQTLNVCDPSDRTSEDFLLLSVKIRIASKDIASAEQMIRDALPAASSRQKSALYYERSRIAAAEEEKLSWLRSSLTANPRNEDALFGMYELYFSKKDYRKAQYYLKQIVALRPNDSLYLELNARLEKLLAR
ncbi:MAG: hypothetical protein NC041_06240 [Bacteroides sp.]|nr:hypothetical protein [Prevotella sp.]MCM1406895.1 hypothetical protein [Treponema brennaborense]MCM1470046.1 hypothetical protein [Bacteroides sp.]